MKNLLILSLLLPMSSQASVTVLAFMTTAPGYEDQFKAAVSRIVEPSRQEPGCLVYNFHQSLSRPNEFFFYEIFASDEAFEAHRHTPHLVKFLKSVKSYTQSDDPRILKYQRQY